METGDKIYLADKKTLDDVNANTADTKAKVGATTDTGGSATAGTLMGKLNALISSILTHVANWTATRAANLDAAISTRESEADAAARYNSISTNTGPDNTPSATGTLSQKLSHIISQLSGMGQKKLASKLVKFTVSTAGTHTILNITGGGRFEFAYTSMGDANSALTIEVDGQAQVFNSEVGAKYIFGSVYGAGDLLYMVPSSSISAMHFAASRPVFFRNSLKITVAATSSTELYFRGNYSLYE